MKKCRTVKGLVKAKESGETATLKVWDIMSNDWDKAGACLNLGEGAYSHVGSKNWKLIRDSIVNQDGEYCKSLNKYQYYYQN